MAKISATSLGGGLQGPKGDKGDPGDGTPTNTYEKLYATSNGAGQNYKVGDDVWIGDVNLSNYMSVQGVQDATKGGIVFGTGLTEKISTDGSNLTLVAGNDVVFTAGSGYAYLGSVTDPNRIAKWSQTLIKKSSVPAHDYGVSGDTAGMFAYDSNYLYICISNYVNNSTVIWKRIGWTAGSW